MKGFSKLHVKSAIKSRNKFDLSCSHMTTLNFGDLMPIHIQDCIIGDDMNMKADSFMRLAPMVVPTFGNIAFKTASIFVPYRTVFEDAEAFFGGDKYNHSRVIKVPTTTVKDLLNLFINVEDGTRREEYTSATTSSDAADLSYRLTTTGAVKNYVFTPFGKRVYKIIRSLGYALPSAVKGTDLMNRELNMLPLLAYAKAYNDWFSRGSDYQTSILSNFLNTAKTKQTFETSDLIAIFANIHLLYEDDYFTTAWRYPNSPIYHKVDGYSPKASAQAPDMGLNSILLRNYSDTNPDNMTAVDNTHDQVYLTTQEQGGSNADKVVNQRSLDFLAAFDKWLRRNNYSGSRAVERVLSRFGIKSSDYRSEYSEMVNMSQSPIQIGDIMANAQTEADVNGDLGSYAGKGIMSDSASFKYKVSDFGMMITFGWIALKPFCPQGADRNVFKTSYSDFYVPEYDGLGASPIMKGELAIQNTGTKVMNPYDVWGFTERYNEYRFGKDRVTGDFELYPEMKSWTIGRDLTQFANDGGYPAQSLQFLSVDYDGEQYNRIFADTNSDVDHFYLTSHFDVSMVRPILNLNQVPQLGEGDTDISRNGTKIS